LKLFSVPNICSKFIDFEIRNLEHIFGILNEFIRPIEKKPFGVYEESLCGGEHGIMILLASA